MAFSLFLFFSLFNLNSTHSLAGSALPPGPYVCVYNVLCILMLIKNYGLRTVIFLPPSHDLLVTLEVPRSYQFGSVGLSINFGFEVSGMICFPLVLSAHGAENFRFP